MCCCLCWRGLHTKCCAVACADVACTSTVSKPLYPVWLTKILQRQIFSTVRLDWGSVTEQRNKPCSLRHTATISLTRLDSVSMSKAVCRHILVIQLNRSAVVVMGNFICNVSVVSDYHFFHGATAPRGSGLPHYRGYKIILRHTTFDRTSLEGRSARRRHPYQTKHNIHKRQTSMHPAGFETAVQASKWP